MTWSDRMTGARRERLVERLRSVLPAPRPYARGARTPLRGAASPEQLAAEMRRLPGFAWLDGGAAKLASHRLTARPLAVLRARGGRASASGPAGRVAFAAGGFDLLEAALAAWGGDGGSLIGYLGYELAWELEALPPAPPDDLGLPDLHLALYDAALVGDGKSWTLETTDAWQGLGAPAGDSIGDPIGAERRLARAAALPPEELPAGSLAGGPVASRPSRGGFEAAVSRAVGRIANGEIFQVNLCRRLEADLAWRHAWPLYLRLRRASPAARGAFFDLGRGRALLSVSPESFLSLRGGRVESRPIKGTRPRGATPQADRALERELLASAKDRAELVMIVDVARNDLGRVAATGSVEVAEHAELLRLPTVLHTASTVRAELRPGAGTVDLLRAAFPPASITGAPKIQAMAVAAAEEERRRGPAMGAFGWLALSGDLELAVAIRTAAVARGRVVYHAGCGIVADSDPEDELAESSLKASAFLTALGAREAG